MSNLADILSILKEVTLIITALKEMGLQLHGTVDLATILALLHPKAGG